MKISARKHWKSSQVVCRLILSLSNSISENSETCSVPFGNLFIMSAKQPNELRGYRKFTRYPYNSIDQTVHRRTLLGRSKSSAGTFSSTRYSLKRESLEPLKVRGDLSIFQKLLRATSFKSSALNRRQLLSVFHRLLRTLSGKVADRRGK